MAPPPLDVIDWRELVERRHRHGNRLGVGQRAVADRTVTS
jgi:hypothetical protein